MKNHSMTIYQHLQNQYKKLNEKIASSKFYQYSQFKQEQLINRLNRCSLQLKHLGMGLGICVALGVATPVMGQYEPPSFVRHNGVSNPIEGLIAYDLISQNPVFVDIDNDGDYDMFAVVQSFDTGFNYVTRIVNYYENIGNKYTASFVQRTGVLNPLDALNQYKDLEFVDIDNDGDLDLFVGVWSNSAYYNVVPSSVYYENTGTATNAVFTQRVGNLDPLDSLNYHYPIYTEHVVSFVDLDNDGDKDCFNIAFHFLNGTKECKYYENQGTASAPMFMRQDISSLDGISSSFPTLLDARNKKLNFFDMDKDGDLDAFLIGEEYTYRYFENLGNVATSIFNAGMPSTVTPFDTISQIGYITNYSIVDIDGDGDLDAFGYASSLPNELDVLYENLDSTITSLWSIAADIPFFVYPNPTTGQLNFEQPITGEFVLYNNIGQKVLEKSMDNQQQINISELDNGVYFMFIEAAKERLRKKIIVQK